ncbi:MAG: hypothetical protein K2X87_26505 [Gemmataceae bacterium]|nr:hypothetical protein [Gemmataceae bacterium]
MGGLSIPVEYNGHVFVPLVQIDLPEGTRCVATVPARKPPLPVTDEHRALWADITRQIEAGTPPYPTVEDAMRALRRGA